MEGLSSTGLVDLVRRFDIIDGTFHAKGCCAGNFLPAQPGVTSCAQCLRAKQLVRKRYLPCLFRAEDNLRQIVSVDQFRLVIHNAVRNFKTPDDFLSSDASVRFVAQLHAIGLRYIDFKNPFEVCSNVFAGAGCHQADS